MAGQARNKKAAARLAGDEEHELRHERVAGTGVAKAKGDVCVRLPPAPGRVRRQSRVWEVPATVPQIAALAGELLGDGVELVSMESTPVICGYEDHQRHPRRQGHGVRVRHRKIKSGTNEKWSPDRLGGRLSVSRTVREANRPRRDRERTKRTVGFRGGRCWKSRR